MGLFSSSKNPCPVCGEATPRLFPTKVDDMPICKECANKVDLPEGALDTMPIFEFRKYIEYHDQNAALREQFKREYTYDVDGWNDQIELDFTHGLFRLRDKKESLVFEKAMIRSFKIMEDNRLLYEGDASGLLCYESEVPERLNQLQPIFEQYYQERRDYERRKQMEEMLDRMHGDDDDNNRQRRFIAEPTFDAPLPAKIFQVTMVLDHPYWPTFNGELNGPTWGVFDPNMADYLRDYQKAAAKLDELAKNLLKFINPGAPIQKIGSQQATPMMTAAAPTPVAAGAPVDAVAEIKKFKELLDMGIITEEEFAAKKRQLLGL